MTSANGAVYWSLMDTLVFSYIAVIAAICAYALLALIRNMIEWGKEIEKMSGNQSTDAPLHTTHALGVASILYFFSSVGVSVLIEWIRPALSVPVKFAVSVLVPLPLFLFVVMWHMSCWREYSNRFYTKLAMSMRGPNER